MVYFIFIAVIGFQVSQDAIDLLSQVKEKIGIIAVAGKYRTGKSFLLNRIILDKKDNLGFGVGPTINPCTKGLWIWNKPIEVTGNPGEAPFKVFIVDSEGIGAFNEDQNHDTRIFLLALLLSSYFVYNSMGTIDENALQNLSLIVNLSKQLQIKNQKAEEADPEEVARYFPSFLWVVRDFALKLLDQYGNPINSKEYLENALKEQKGTSDNVEKKNRIRRLILNFFRERDCYTMVRPTEEEKDLQALQRLQDDKLRPEFISQMTNLRQRIFKRVKPKNLNGKFITGELFIELCKSYTQAINKGSVPCIESAWTYLCQNENQRAIQESITYYDDAMKKKIFTNATKTECVDYSSFKESHKVSKDEALTHFKEKAVGENLNDFQNKILDEIQKKYIAFKQKCLQTYDSKCNQVIKKDVDTIDLNIRQDKYQTLSDFYKDLEQLKVTYKEETSKIIYQQKDLVLKNICEKLLIKAFEEISRKDKEQMTNQSRALQEKLNYLEKDIVNKKQEFEEERKCFEQKSTENQLELQSLRSNTKLLEERFKMVENEKFKLDAQLKEKIQLINEQKNKIENELNGQIKQFQLQVKQMEERQFKSESTFEKDIAILQQKLTYSEREVSQLQQKVDSYHQDNKSLLEKQVVSDQQIKNYEQKLQLTEQERRKEINSLKESYEKKLSDIKSSDSETSLEKQRLWEKERTFMQEQLQFSNKQIEENKRMHEMVLQAINQKNQDKDQDTQVMQTNKVLSETIAQVEQKNHVLQQKIGSIKIYQRVFKHSQSMQCKFCQVFFPSEIFIEHVKGCNKDNRYSRSIFFQIPLSISIIQTLIKEDPNDNRTYTEYAVQINFNNKTWIINQKYKAFCNLHEKLINQYPNIKFPQSSFQFATKSISDLHPRGKTPTQGGPSSMIEDRRKILQQYLQDLALIPAIKESPHFKMFIGIQDHFPEFWDEHAMLASNILTNENVSTKQPHSNPSFKLMSDLFVNKKQQDQLSKLPVANINEKVENALSEKGHFTSSAKTNQKNRYATLSSNFNATPTKIDLITEEQPLEQPRRHHQMEDDDFCIQENSNEKSNRFSMPANMTESAKKNLTEGVEEFSKNLFQKEIGKSKCQDITNSMSYKNLMYSPSQIDNTILDRNYQPTKENYNDRGQSHCKIEKEFFRDSIEELPSMIGQSKQHSNQVVEVSQSYQNLALLGELVRKSVNQVPQFSNQYQQSVQLTQESNQRSREKLGNHQYVNQMKSDKYLSDILSRDKNNSFHKVQNTTPTKKSFINTSQKSPFSNLNQASNSNTPLSLATTPDQLKRASGFEYQNQGSSKGLSTHGNLMRDNKGIQRSSEKLRSSKK